MMTNYAAELSADRRDRPWNCRGWLDSVRSDLTIDQDCHDSLIRQDGPKVARTIIVTELPVGGDG
jgi:hypothetical protein